ncbi:MAG: hypothetical protein JO152_06150 [Mycobacteriaceae bacterium]|nr:hypothetical protein [Mycobacteriaceae bacterium]
MTASQPRPRVVDAAFWSWLAAAALLVVFGLLIALMASTPVPVFYRGAGGLFAVAGFAIGYLAGRTRRGDRRFRRATVSLTLVLAVLLTLFAVKTLGYIWLVIIVLLMTAAALAMRPAASEWFDAVDPPPGGRGD